eukprot:TRINITY_DN6668_c0_g1_i1.p1 TRINITY_DN6668_c0_g1~~TRINITY_DN6668_c0_g1_i1.p1  ORF type:complete len:538 (-),score=120.63 TRINITY_DN6668_c0_g1_i1:23-1600(-)
MGRGKQFKKDRLYITQAEWTESFGGKKKDTSKAYHILQFDSCNLTFQPWTDPVCTPEGAIFDLINIMPWLRKHKVNPITGAPMKPGDLISLKFEKDADGKFCCPATKQVFTDHTHIVAIKTTGNVYSYKAVETLNIKPKKWTDIQTGEPFTRADIIVLQDPQRPELHDSKNYYFVKNNLTARKKEVQSDDPLSRITLSTTSERVFKEMKEKEEEEKVRQQKIQLEKGPIEEEEEEEPEKKKIYRGTDAGSFTSTDFRPKAAEKVPWKAKKTSNKGYVRLVTSLGNINIRLHCDLAPLACENFLTHSSNGYYNGTIFHRSIRNFMIQGGDPQGTGKGGASIWGKPFPDEFHKSLRHDGEGVLSMANAGKNTNGSQFFILYKSAPHLNDKHTVFGNVVGGKEILKQMANIETDLNDKPKTDIVLTSVLVYTNPFDEEEMKKEQISNQEKEKKEKESKEYGTWLSNPTAALAPELANKAQSTSLIGKYITPESDKTAKKRGLNFGAITTTTSAPQKKRKTGYGDFSNF